MCTRCPNDLYGIEHPGWYEKERNFTVTFKDSNGTHFRLNVAGEAQKEYPGLTYVWKGTGDKEKMIYNAPFIR